MNVSERFRSISVIPVITVTDIADAVPLADALVNGGLPAAEVTFRSEGAPETIKNMLQKYPDMLVGAGTVLTLDQALLAFEAGAKFIVAPGLNPRIAEFCQVHAIPFMPGIATATELDQAMNLGFHQVKFFPAEPMGGLRTIKALSAPYHMMEFMPTGGVNLSNAESYLAFSKVYAVGGSWIAPTSLLLEKRFDRIERNAREAAELVKRVRG